MQGKTETDMDATKRKLEREAALNPNGPEAERLARMNSRAGNGRHHDKIGKWVVVDGVRDHYRGKLTHVTELGAGQAILHLAPCKWLDNMESPSGERATRATAENPFDLYSHVVEGISLQPADWPEE